MCLCITGYATASYMNDPESWGTRSVSAPSRNIWLQPDQEKTNAEVEDKNNDDDEDDAMDEDEETKNDTGTEKENDKVEEEDK